MKSSGLFRIGRDVECRFLPNGDAVANISLAYNFGKKDANSGDRPTQWIEGSLFGKRAETLAPYLLKGNQIVVHLADLHIETFEGKNGTGTKLVGRIDDVELTDRKEGQQAATQTRQAPPQPAQTLRQGQSSPQRAAQRQAPAGASQGSGFDDMDSDIPF